MMSTRLDITVKLFYLNRKKNSFYILSAITVSSQKIIVQLHILFYMNINQSVMYLTSLAVVSFISVGFLCNHDYNIRHKQIYQVLLL
jgi:hypothetical protein